MVLTFFGRTMIAEVILASPNGKSLALVFNGILGAYVGMIPVGWNDARGEYVDFFGQVAVVTPYPS